MQDRFQQVCDNFDYQSKYCDRIGSPFYAKLLPELGSLIRRDTAIGRLFANWAGPPKDDAVALRFVAALHYLVITEADSDLTELFPPRESLSATQRKAVLERVLAEHESLILEFLQSAPQTNEVGRSAVLLGGFLLIAEQFDGEFDVFEIGASAGLNHNFDHYFYFSDNWQWGNSSAKVQIELNWDGKYPPSIPLKIQNRSASDITPVDLKTSKEKLLSYLWPDQFERLKRSRAAIEVAIKNDFPIEECAAADWVERIHERISAQRPSVIYHSIAWQYFSENQKTRVTKAIEKLGAEANLQRPLIWMRLEPAKDKSCAELTLTIWPGKKTQVVAESGYHGEWVKWI